MAGDHVSSQSVLDVEQDVTPMRFIPPPSSFGAKFHCLLSFSITAIDFIIDVSSLHHPQTPHSVSDRPPQIGSSVHASSPQPLCYKLPRAVQMASQLHYVRLKKSEDAHDVVCNRKQQVMSRIS